MEKKSLEKVISTDVEDKSLIEKLFFIIRSNRYSLGCALLILVLTIIVVPIVYTRKEVIKDTGLKPLSWDINGKTIVDQNSLLNNLTNNPFGLICALKFDMEDNLYILDQRKNRILKYFLSNSFLQLIFGFKDGRNGNDSLSLNSPNDFDFDSEKNLYIADTFNHRILFVPFNSNQSRIILGTGISGSNLNELNQPMSLTRDEKSNIYICDYGNNRIILFNLRINQAKILIPFNENGERNSYLLTPISIRYSSLSNSLVIAQEFGYNVVRYLLDSNEKNWKLIAGSASSQLNGTSRTLFNRVCSCEINSRGNTYVVDCDNQRIEYYIEDLFPGKTIAGVIQAKGKNSYLFNDPIAIALDSQDNLYVADSNNYRIQRFFQLH